MQSEDDAKRLVIDSLAVLKWHCLRASAPTSRIVSSDDLRLDGNGVTILSTVEVDESFTESRSAHYSISPHDDIIRLRYVSIDGQLRRSWW